MMQQAYARGVSPYMGHMVQMGGNGAPQSMLLGAYGGQGIYQQQQQQHQQQQQQQQQQQPHLAPSSGGGAQQQQQQQLSSNCQTSSIASLQMV
jgi:hypothetical protein